MEKRRLGNSELYVNPVGLGCMGFSHASGDPMEKGAAVKTIREAYEIGYDFFIRRRFIPAFMRTARFPIMKSWSERP